MKNTKVCPKCGSHEVVIVSTGVSGPFRDDIAIGILHFAIPVTRRLCCGCGFMELWVDDPENLDKIKNKYDRGQSE
jgi:hypothetical protein